MNYEFVRGARKLMGEILKVVWAKFSTLSLVVFVCERNCVVKTKTAILKVENSAQVLSCWLKFVHSLSIS
jgi:hypothetical protein